MKDEKAMSDRVKETVFPCHVPNVSAIMATCLNATRGAAFHSLPHRGDSGLFPGARPLHLGKPRLVSDGTTTARLGCKRMRAIRKEHGKSKKTIMLLLRYIMYISMYTSDVLGRTYAVVLIQLWFAR